MTFSMRVRRWLLTLFMLATAGACAQQLDPYANLTGEEALRYQSARAHTELGAAYYGSGQMGVALEELTIATEVYPKYAPAFYTIGLVHMDMKEDKLAERAFQRAIDLDPSSSEAYNNYGWFLCQRGRIDDGIKQFMTALKNPRYETPDKPYVNAGICSLKRNDDTAAMEYFERALKLQPNHPQALYYAADIYFRHADPAAAKSMLLRYMKVTNPSPEALWLGVRVERKMGDRPTEESYAQMLRQRYPESRETQLLKVGRYE